MSDPLNLVPFPALGCDRLPLALSVHCSLETKASFGAASSCGSDFLSLDWCLRWHGDVGLLLPPALRQPALGPGFADGLWQRSCFELFVGRLGQPRYVEWNMAPSGDWAAYGFDDYRLAQRPLRSAKPYMAWRLRPREWRLRLEIPWVMLEAALDFPGEGWSSALETSEWLLGLSAVLQLADGRLTYWALRHAGAKADFHRQDGWLGVRDLLE